MCFYILRWLSYNEVDHGFQLYLDEVQEGLHVYLVKFHALKVDPDIDLFKSVRRFFGQVSPDPYLKVIGFLAGIPEILPYINADACPEACEKRVGRRHPVTRRIDDTFIIF